MPYTITFQQSPSLPDLHRRRAEAIYREELEAALGGPDAVIEALAVWNATQDEPGDQITLEGWREARRWILATNRARTKAIEALSTAIAAQVSFVIDHQ